MKVGEKTTFGRIATTFRIYYHPLLSPFHIFRIFFLLFRREAVMLGYIFAARCFPLIKSDLDSAI